MYDTLLQLPLFQGLCTEDLTNIIEKVKLQFVKQPNGALIAQQGEACRQLVFLLKGELASERKDPKGLFTWNEFFRAPFVVEPYSLFGMHPHYTANYRAEDNAQLLCVDKNYILSVLSKYEVFQLNYLNILSNRAQTFRDRLLQGVSHSAKEQILSFFLCNCEYPTGRKLMHIKMEDLAWIVNDTRLSISHVLNDWQDNGLAVLRRKEIEIPEMSHLVTYVQQQT